jgi:hypothetical protein
MRNPKPSEQNMSRNSRELSCKHRLGLNLANRLTDLRRLWEADCAGRESESERLCNYGLCFDYVAPGTFDDQREGYFRYQLSWGGPSDEFRFFVNPDLSLHRVEYWFLDWFDGANRVLTGQDEKFITELWGWFYESATAQWALGEPA